MVGRGGAGLESPGRARQAKNTNEPGGRKWTSVSSSPLVSKWRSLERHRACESTTSQVKGRPRLVAWTVRKNKDEITRGTVASLRS